MHLIRIRGFVIHFVSDMAKSRLLLPLTFEQRWFVFNVGLLLVTEVLVKHKILSIQCALCIIMKCFPPSPILFNFYNKATVKFVICTRWERKRD